ncbi:hypothetical protein [Vibrio owensii]|uniref:hypothetical protein n=1 Tax=Vibrio harveyi group TaxID=717610 RepID=UPI003CC55696
MKQTEINPSNNPDSNESMMVFNCAKCGEGEVSESKVTWNEDETASCQCGQKLMFRHTYTGKKNLISFK